MSERLTDEELARINGTPWTDVNRVVTPGMQVAMAIELRQRRAADLTAEEREALAFAKVVMTAGTKWEHAMHDPAIRGHVERCRRSIAALSKLLATGGAISSHATTEGE